MGGGLLHEGQGCWHQREAQGSRWWDVLVSFQRSGRGGGVQRLNRFSWNDLVMFCTLTLRRGPMSVSGAVCLLWWGPCNVGALYCAQTLVRCGLSPGPCLPPFPIQSHAMQSPPSRPPAHLHALPPTNPRLPLSLLPSLSPSGVIMCARHVFMLVLVVMCGHPCTVWGPLYDLRNPVHLEDTCMDKGAYSGAVCAATHGMPNVPCARCWHTHWKGPDTIQSSRVQRSLHKCTHHKCPVTSEGPQMVQVSPHSTGSTHQGPFLAAKRFMIN